jgi:hypothetical protein
LHEEVDSYFATHTENNSTESKQQTGGHSTDTSELDAAFHQLANVDMHYMSAVRVYTLSLVHIARHFITYCWVLCFVSGYI